MYRYFRFRQRKQRFAVWYKQITMADHPVIYSLEKKLKVDNIKWLLASIKTSVVSCGVVVLVRVAYTSRSQQRLVFPLDSPLFAFLNIVQILLRLCISLRVSSKGAWQTSFPPFAVRPVGGRPARSRMLNGRMRCTVPGKTVRMGIMLWSSEFVINTHYEHRPLHHCCDEIDNPCAPSGPSKSAEEAGREQETTWSLNAHHRYTQTSDVLQVVGSPDLGHILHTSKGSSHDTEEIGPESEVIRDGDEEDSRDDHNDEAVENAEQANHDGGLPSRGITTKLLWGYICLSIAEEDQEQNETSPR